MAEAVSGRAQVLLEETVEGVRTLTLNRPDKKNALSSDLIQALIEALEAAASDDAVRVVSVRGAGDAFCAGADLKDRKLSDTAGEPAPSVEDQVVRLVTLMRVKCEKPIVAGIDGIAIGAGLSLAMCADIRIASASARFHPGYARAGSSPDAGLSWTLPQAIGHERAMNFLLRPRMWGPEEAHALGIVAEVFPVAEFASAVAAACREIAEVAPIAAQQTKRLVAAGGALAGLEDHLRAEIDLAKRALGSEDGREAVRAIFEKRKPVFTGR